MCEINYEELIKFVSENIESTDPLKRAAAHMGRLHMRELLAPSIWEQITKNQGATVKWRRYGSVKVGSTPPHSL